MKSAPHSLNQTIQALKSVTTQMMAAESLTGEVMSAHMIQQITAIERTELEIASQQIMVIEKALTQALVALEREDLVVTREAIFNALYELNHQSPSIPKLMYENDPVLAG
ncbi:TPA: hypothetical protein ACX6RL_000898 [Photobacterium damselae]